MLFRSSAIKPSIFETPYIGKNAVRVQLEQAKEKSRELGDQCREKQNILRNLEELQNPLSTDIDTDIKYRVDVLTELCSTRQEIRNCKDNIATLEKNSNVMLKQIQLAELEKIIREVEEQISRLNRKVGQTEQNIGRETNCLDRTEGPLYGACRQIRKRHPALEP